MIQMNMCLLWEESCKKQTSYNGTKYILIKIVHMNFCIKILKSQLFYYNLFDFSGTVNQLLRDNYITTIIDISICSQTIKLILTHFIVVSNKS